jgi:hypothetical protein
MDETVLCESLGKCLLTEEEVAEGIEAWNGLEDPFPIWSLTVEESFTANP